MGPEHAHIRLAYTRYIKSRLTHTDTHSHTNMCCLISCFAALRAVLAILMASQPTPPLSFTSKHTHTSTRTCCLIFCFAALGVLIARGGVPAPLGTLLSGRRVGFRLPGDTSTSTPVVSLSVPPATLPSWSAPLPPLPVCECVCMEFECI